jgi:hypothetical protein
VKSGHAVLDVRLDIGRDVDKTSGAKGSGEILERLK